VKTPDRNTMIVVMAGYLAGGVAILFGEPGAAVGLIFFVTFVFLIDQISR
jgi:hypothetical protein